MFIDTITDEEQINGWKKKFNEASPFRFIVIDNFLDLELAGHLSTEFPSLNEMDVNYNGINERKSEHSSFDNLHPSFKNLKRILAQRKITETIEKIARIDNLQVIEDRYGIGLHQGGRNSFLDIHVDYNLHPIKKKQRRLNLIIFLNREWQEEWGGSLEFWSKDLSQCMQSILPVFNRAVLFECTEYSYHGYSQITCPENTTRKSFYQYYFSEPEQKLIFHDTIFQNKPIEAPLKRAVVISKEFTKNFMKRILYYSGLNRFLK